MLEKIKKPNDVKKIPAERLPELAEEIRGFLIESLSRTGGHLASNLGVVELTIALHRVYTLPEDKIIWDVGHQAYTHKILTGGKRIFGCCGRREGSADSQDGMKVPATLWIPATVPPLFPPPWDMSGPEI